MNWIDALLATLAIALWMVFFALVLGEHVAKTKLGRRLNAWYTAHLTRPFERAWEWLVGVLRRG